MDAHENIADLEQAHAGYRRALDAFERYRGEECVVTLNVTELTRDGAIGGAAAAMRAWLARTSAR